MKRLLLCAAILAVGCAAERPRTEVAAEAIGYPSYEAALADLRAKPDIKFFDHDSWVFAYDHQNNVVWSFSPSKHYAYPTVVKRTITQQNGHLHVETKVYCQNNRWNCSVLVDELARQNEWIPKFVEQ